MSKSRHRILTPAQQEEAQSLREKIKIVAGAGYRTSAAALRRKLRALLGGYDPEAAERLLRK